MKSIKNLPSQGECKINRNHIKKPLVKKIAIQELKNREGGFVLNGDVINQKLNYDPINDEHLKQFFVNKKIKPYLNKLSKIVNRSNHTSDDDQISKDDTTRITNQNNTKNSHMTAPNLKQKSESEPKDIRTIKIQEGGDDDSKQQEVLKEKEKNYQQIEFPKISINNSTNFNNYTLNNSNTTNLNSTKENSNINQNNTSMNFLNNSINNSNTLYANSFNNAYNSSSQDQSGRISNQEFVKKNDFKLQAIPKSNNQYQSSGLRNKIILRPIQNQDKLDKDSLDIKKAYGQIKQEEQSSIYRLPQKRNSQNSLNCTAINSDQENYTSSDYKVNPIKSLDAKKKIRSITGNKKTGFNDTTLSTLDHPQQQSQNQSMYDGYINSLKKGGIIQSNSSSKPFICEPNQIYFKNLKSEIENIEKQNESKGIVPVSKDQFSSFLNQFKTKYKSNTNLNQNDEQEDQLNHSENKKIEIQQLKKEKQEIIKRQEQELYELEQKIMQFEIQEKELHNDICLLDQKKQKLYNDQDDYTYYMNKIVIPSPKKNENFVIHEQVHDEETYRSLQRKSKAHCTEQIEEDLEEMMYTKPIYGDNSSKKWLSEEKNYSKSTEKLQQNHQEDYKTEFDYSDEQKSFQGKQKINQKNSFIHSQNGYETDELHNNNQQNEGEITRNQNSQIKIKSTEKKCWQNNQQNSQYDNQQDELCNNQQNQEDIYQNNSQNKSFQKKHQSPKSVEKQNTPKIFKNSQQKEHTNQNDQLQNSEID
ncbi:hypothetical protein TTHERM_01043340 (macronuclear) [Tetrahymena thermophila SB210]|uniref:Uncharacterized protein n=1 Tax=Tetrahymena thermophila (strain SB210) TaxID=312017 RepID=Q22CH5_TETTS|nr:hypothetical protein TTHERM_01043340 [Tetrahymena thermophila SB210]EAR83017.2 hypothetical protein TTHERM_01043340 [Tetrahymena thermophila SB210]|eukprot:XP_001030680.2 hypothetical protein TTHERM_01043340 [Tetrahymena thermophila SB210]